MNKSIIVLTAALGVGAVIALAQDAGGGRRGGPGGPSGFGGPGGGRPQPAIITALDANKDGKLDAAEIANASVALKTLDKNGDGEITADEMFGGPRAGGPGQPPPPQNNQPTGLAGTPSLRWQNPALLVFAFTVCALMVLSFTRARLSPLAR